MPDLTPTEIAARLDRLDAAVGLGPITPPPGPGPALPVAPTGLRLTTLPDGRLQLDWDSAAGVRSWDVLDVLDTAAPVKDIVTAPRSTRSALKVGTRRRYAVRAQNAAGTSPLSAALDVPATTTTPPPPSGSVPAAVLDLTRWYLTLPVADPSGRDSSGPWDVYQPELATFAHPDLFRTGTDAAAPYVEYVAPAKGVSTSGSGAARCELREMTGPGRDLKAAWSFDDGKPHTLTATLTCDGTSIVGRKEVIVGQIHGPGGTPPLILCVNHTRGGALEVFRQGPRQGDLLTGLAPGEQFSYRIDASGGRLKLYACRGGVGALPSGPAFDWQASVLTERAGCYFKAGAYLKQEIGTATTGAAAVRHYRLELV